MAGRKANEKCYFELQLVLVKLSNKKYTALCEICGKRLSNTAVLRLKAHRSVCREKLKSVVDESVKLGTSTCVNRSSSTSKTKTLDSDLYVDEENNISDAGRSDMISISDIERQTFHPESSTILAEFEFHGDAGAYISDISNENPCLHVNEDSSACFSDAEPNLQSAASSSSSTSGVFLLPFAQTSKNVGIKAMTTRGVKAKGSNKLTKFVDQVTSTEINNFNEELAKFFYGCNIPLSVVESDHFRQFISKIRPAYGEKLPSRKFLSSSLLDIAYKKCIDKTTDSLNSHSVLLIDGWKNTSSNTKTVVSMLHNAMGSQAFLNAWDLTGESETGGKLSEIVNESIDLSKKLYNTTVYAVVSDNAAAMIKMGRIVDIWHSNCSSHTGNLLAKDVLDENFTKKVVSILKEFKQADFEKSLVNKGGYRIKTPVDTRWCSYRDSYVCLIKNLNFMRILIINDPNPNYKKIKQNVKSLVFDDDCMEQIKDNIALFDPICELINRTQSKDCSIAEASYLWLRLKFPTKYNHWNSKLDYRRNMALNIYALSAYYLHPVYNKTAELDLNITQRGMVQDFLLENLDGSGIADLQKFKEKNDGVFKTLYSKNIIDPILFWNMALLKHPNLSSFALKLIQIPASSAQIERVFSNWSYVHSPIRNRLIFERSKKLLDIYYSLKVQDSNSTLKEKICLSCLGVT